MQIMVINRAAWTLNNLDADEAVPALIRALLTYEQRIVMVPPNNGNAGPDSGMPLVPIAREQRRGRLPDAAGGRAGSRRIRHRVDPRLWTARAWLTSAARSTPRPSPGVVTFTYRNTEVLAALQKLTGQDFDYNVAAWREWMSRRVQSDAQAVAQGSAAVSGTAAALGMRRSTFAQAFSSRSRPRSWQTTRTGDWERRHAAACLSPRAGIARAGRARPRSGRRARSSALRPAPAPPIRRGREP